MVSCCGGTPQNLALFGRASGVVLRGNFLVSDNGGGEDVLAEITRTVS